MCLAIPGKIISIDSSTNMASLDVLGVERNCSVDLVPDVAVGDYVLVHAGFAISVIDETEAAETLDIIQQLAELTAPESMAVN